MQYWLVRWKETWPNVQVVSQGRYHTARRETRTQTYRVLVGTIVIWKQLLIFVHRIKFKLEQCVKQWWLPKIIWRLQCRRRLFLLWWCCLLTFLHLTLHIWFLTCSAFLCIWLNFTCCFSYLWVWRVTLVWQQVELSQQKGKWLTSSE